MENFTSFILLIFFLNNLLFTSCSFQLSFFKELNSKEKNNVVFSPYAVIKSLTLLSYGAKGLTQAQILSALEKGSVDELKSLFNDIRDIKLKNSVIMANGIFSKASPSKEFVSFCEGLHSNASQITNGDDINKWCSNETNNKINNIVKEIKNDATIYLLNAFYFKSNWLKEFNKELTTIKKFRNYDKTISKIEIMTVSDRFPFYENREAQIIEVPYTNNPEETNAYIILPGRDIDINNYLNNLSPEKIETLLGRLSVSRVELSLPKFDIEVIDSLKSSLMKIGINSAFLQGMGDFRTIAKEGGLYVTDMLHKVRLRFDEQSTGEYTEVTDKRKPRDVQGNVTMNVLRPFLLIIKDTTMNEYLLCAKIGKL